METTIAAGLAAAAGGGGAPAGTMDAEVPASSGTAVFAYTCEPLTGEVPTSEKTRVLHCLRHAQGTHNIAVATEGEGAYANWDYRDARLTPTGFEQAKSAVAKMATLECDAILVSPLSRTIQTAVTAIPSGCDRMFALELIRERYGLNPCDLRREKNELQKEFPMINFDTLENETDHLWSPEREPLPTLQKRANDFLAYIFENAFCGRQVGIVTHNDFLTMLLYDSALIMGPGMPENRKFANCESNSYVITRKEICPNVDTLSEEQKARYPKSAGNTPVVQ